MDLRREVDILPNIVFIEAGLSLKSVCRLVNMHPALLHVQVVGSYLRRRLLRIVPSYYATLALVYFAFLPLLNNGARSGSPEARHAIATLWFNPGDGCPDKLWANFTFMNNQLQRAGCMKYAWSQAVQVGLYILLSPCTWCSN